MKKIVTKKTVKKLIQKSDIHIARESINQKTERSEQDVKREMQNILIPLSVLVCINLFLTFLLLGIV